MSTAAIALTLLLTLPADQGQGNRVVRVSPPEVQQPVEVSIGINPRDANNLLVVGLARGNEGVAYTNFAFHSHDGGSQWKATACPNPDRRIQADDVVSFAADGVAYHGYISYQGLFQRRPRAPRNGIFVSASPDGGKSWNEPAAVVDHRNTITPFEDKPALAVDRVAESPHQGRVYVAWTRFDEYGSREKDDHTHIYYSQSSDQGKSFSAPLRISQSPGDCRDSDDTVMGAYPAAGANGEVYVVWAGPQGIVFDRSLDGGLNFDEDRVITQTPEGWDFEVRGLARANGLPILAVDHSGGSRRGTIYVNWVDHRNGDPDVFVMNSSDRGETWSPPVRVNDDPVRNGKEQFFTSLAVDPQDGSVNVIFYDRRESDDATTRLVMARSVDGGRSFKNFSVNLAPFQTRGRVFFGDYLGIDARSGKVAAAFPHFVEPGKTAVSAAVFNFKPGTLEQTAPRVD